jgi:enamine deaminase RidA (YjgF/YER057c/UK114 family)
MFCNGALLTQRRLAMTETHTTHYAHSRFAEQRLEALNITLPPPPRPLGQYVETLQTGKLLFLSGTLPIEAGVPHFRGRIGADLTLADGQRAARLATLNALALAREHLESLNRVRQVVRLGVSMVTTTEFHDHPLVADAASELLASVFGPDKVPTRVVLGMASLPLGLCIEVEVLFEIAD